MWGPYSRTTYSRSFWQGTDHDQSMSATYKVNSALTATKVYMESLLATFQAQANLAINWYGKLMAGTYQATATFTRYIGFAVSATYEIAGTFVRQIAFPLSATYEMTGALNKLLQKVLSATYEMAVSKLKAQHIYIFEYTGDFEAGDQIIIDREDWSVTKNGSNDLSNTDGDLPYFENGTNILEYSDDEEARTVSIRVRWRGRWL